MKEVVLCGSGGHAKVVLSLLKSLGYAVPYILDDEPNEATASINGVPIRGRLSLLPDRKDVSGFLAIEDNRQREYAARCFKNVNWVTLIHPAAWVDPSAKVAAGCYIAAGAVVNADAVLGNHVVIDSGASVGHDCIVEDFVQVESGVRLGGGAHLARGALCAIGSAVIPNCSIGAGATLGPRAVAVKNVPAGGNYSGVPARPLPDQIEHNHPSICATGLLPKITDSRSTVTLLISSAGRRVELVRCFQADAKALGLNLRVLATDAEPELSSACQAADKWFRVPQCTNPGFVSELLQICAKESVSLVVPTIDPELQTLADQRQEFEVLGTRVVVSSSSVVRMARDKAATAEFLNQNNIPAPRTALLAELLLRPETWSWPLILKPAHGSGSVGICIARSPEEARLALGKHNTYIAQELLQGREYTVNLFFDRAGNLRSAVPHQRHEIRAGEVSKGITRRESSLVNLAWRLGSVLKGAVGSLCFQAITADNGQPVIFEINARFGGGYPLAHQAGATFTKWLLEEAAGLPSSANDRWQEGMTMLRYDAAVFRPATPDK